MVSRKLKVSPGYLERLAMIGLAICALLTAWLICAVCSGSDYSLISEPQPALIAASDDYSLMGQGKSKKRYRVLMGTESWCGPCMSFKTYEVPKLEKSGWTVGSETDHIQYVSQEHAAKLGYGSIPAFIILDDDKPIAGHMGFMSAKQFSDWFNGCVAPKKTQEVAVDPSRHWSFPGSGTEDLVRHLAGENHGYSLEQLRGMSPQQLYQLHDRDHESGRVTVRQQRRGLTSIFGRLF